MSKRDVLLAIYNISKLKSLANNAKIRSSLKFLLLGIYKHIRSQSASKPFLPNRILTFATVQKKTTFIYLNISTEETSAIITLRY